MSADTWRAALLLEYDGTDYQGLQWQKHTRATIQEQVENAVRTTGAPEPHFIAAGRTDSGVHAQGQVVAVSLPAKLEERRAAVALNALLPRDIRVRRARRVAEDFSPRHDAISRTYVYRLAVREEPPALLRGQVAFLGRAVDPALMHAAAESFQGKWELAEWRSGSCQATRTLLTITGAAARDPEPAPASPFDPPRHHWEVLFTARSFLHHQVRLMTGAVVAVATGKLPLEALRQSLREGRRPREVAMLDACGLCFMRVDFPPEKDPFA